MEQHDGCLPSSRRGHSSSSVSGVCPSFLKRSPSTASTSSVTSCLTDAATIHTISTSVYDFSPSSPNTMRIQQQQQQQRRQKRPGMTRGGHNSTTATSSRHLYPSMRELRQCLQETQLLDASTRHCLAKLDAAKAAQADDEDAEEEQEQEHRDYAGNGSGYFSSTSSSLRQEAPTSASTRLTRTTSSWLTNEDIVKEDAVAFAQLQDQKARELEDLRTAQALQDEFEREQEVLLREQRLATQHAMNVSISGRAWRFVQAVIALDDQVKSLNPHLANRISCLSSSSAAGNGNGSSTINNNNNLVFQTEAILHQQEAFRQRRRHPTHGDTDTFVDLGLHYTQTAHLARIRTDGLLTKREREARFIYTQYNGSSMGDDGIYTTTGNNHVLGRTGQYGNTGIIVARLPGRVRRHYHHPPHHHHHHHPYDHDDNCGDDDEFDSICNEPTVVLKCSSQCLALIEFSRFVILDPMQSALVDFYYDALQVLVDECFNGRAFSSAPAQQQQPRVVIPTLSVLSPPSIIDVAPKPTLSTGASAAYFKDADAKKLGSPRRVATTTAASFSTPTMGRAVTDSALVSSLQYHYRLTQQREQQHEQLQRDTYDIATPPLSCAFNTSDHYVDVTGNCQHERRQDQPVQEQQPQHEQPQQQQHYASDVCDSLMTQLPQPDERSTTIDVIVKDEQESNDSTQTLLTSDRRQHQQQEQPWHRQSSSRPPKQHAYYAKLVEAEACLGDHLQ